MVLKYLKIYIYKEDSRVFKINDIDIDKIRVSNKKLYNKEHGSHKHYFLYENDNEYIHLKISLLDVYGYYNIFKGNSKTMNFNLDDNSFEKILIYLIVSEKYQALILIIIHMETIKVSHI